MKLKDWHKGFFRKEVFFPGEPRHVAMAGKEARFAVKALGLRKRDSILDLCCGTGRHSLEFAKRGMEVTGLDATPAYLREARRLALTLHRSPARGGGAGVRGGSLSFLLGDMRRIPYKGRFDAVVNLWTSFGYFPREADDRKTLRGVTRALKPGGRLLIDIIDADYLRKHGQPRRWDRREDGSFLLEDFRIQEGRDPHHTNTWTILRRGRRPVVRTFFVRSYDFDRLSRALGKAGLTPVRRWGGLDGSAYRKGRSRRLVVLAKKN